MVKRPSKAPDDMDSRKMDSQNSEKMDSQKNAFAKGKKPPEHERDLKLSRKDAMGGSPSDVSVGGEEDAGVALEFLVNRDDD